MSTQNQNQNQNPGENQNPQQNQGNQNQPSSPSNPQNESLRSEKQERGLEQNDHTYEGENDVTHSPKRTGEPQNQSQDQAQNQNPTDSFRGQSKFTQNQNQESRAGYAQNEHDKTPEANAKDTNATDPRESDEPQKGSL